MKIWSLFIICILSGSFSYGEELLSVWGSQYRSPEKATPFKVEASTPGGRFKRIYEVLYFHQDNATLARTRILRDTVTGLIWSTRVRAETTYADAMGTRTTTSFTYDQQNLKAQTNWEDVKGEGDSAPAYFGYAVTVNDAGNITDHTLCSSKDGLDAFRGVLGSDQILSARLPLYEEFEEARDFLDSPLTEDFSRRRSFWTAGGSEDKHIRYPSVYPPYPERTDLNEVICVYETDHSIPVEELGLNI